MIIYNFSSRNYHIECVNCHVQVCKSGLRHFVVRFNSMKRFVLCSKCARLLINNLTEVLEE